MFNIVDIWTLCVVTKNNGYINFVDYFILFVHGYFVHIYLFIDSGCTDIQGLWTYGDVRMFGSIQT